MAHNITERDGMFTVRQPAWHGLGEVLSDYPTRSEAKAIAHPWEPQDEPLYRRILVGMNPDGTPHYDYHEVETGRLVTRDDDGHELGVVSPTFSLTTNDQLYDLAEAIVQGDDRGDVLYETGGSLNGGRKVWLLMRLAEPIEIVGDPNGSSIVYYALQNSHDGTGALRGQGLTTRIVCDNTSHMADAEAQARGTEFVFKHTKNIDERIADARKALSGWRKGVDEHKAVAEHLLSLGIDIRQRDLFLAEFVPMPPDALVSDRVKHNVTEAREQIRRILESATCEGIAHTAWGLTQAAVEWTQHVRAARSRETRFARSYLAHDKVVRDAYNLAREVATAS